MSRPILHIVTETMEIASEINQMLERYKGLRKDYIVLVSTREAIELKVFNGDEVKEMNIEEFKEFLKVGK